MTDRAPFIYTVFFENLETATAAAQEVVVTDQLDTDASTSRRSRSGRSRSTRLTLSPAPGVQAWSGGADLRPEENLVVSSTPALDEATGIVTWRFRSLDPDTLELPDDPLAGFLAPNVTPPEGDGSVSFTVAPKSEVADGDTICNGASIVFDINEPILTPTFCNTLDESPPVSEVEALPPVSPAAPFTVALVECGRGLRRRWARRSSCRWMGRLTRSSSTRARTRRPQSSRPSQGTLYAFYSVAADAAGNAEAEPDVADAETTTEGAGDHDLAVLAVKAPRRVALTAKRPNRALRRCKVQLQSRSAHPETITTLEQLRALATVRVDSLGACPDAEAVLREAPLAKKLPLTWKPKKKLQLTYDVTFDCANDAATGAADYEVSARVSHLALGTADAHPQDDVCPRTVTPPERPTRSPTGSSPTAAAARSARTARVAGPSWWT